MQVGAPLRQKAKVTRHQRLCFWGNLKSLEQNSYQSSEVFLFWEVSSNFWAPTSQQTLAAVPAAAPQPSRAQPNSQLLLADVFRHKTLKALMSILATKWYTRGYIAFLTAETSCALQKLCSVITLNTQNQRVMPLFFFIFAIKQVWQTVAPNVEKDNSICSATWFPLVSLL